MALKMNAILVNRLEHNRVARESYLSCREDFPTEASGGLLMYERTDGSPLRMMGAVACLCMMISSGLAVRALYTYLSAMRDPGAPLCYERALAACGAAILFTTLFLSVWVYERRIIARLVLLPGGLKIRATNITLFGTHNHEVPLTEVMVLEQHRGDRAGEEAVSASWLHLRAHGRGMVLPLDGPSEDMAKLVHRITYLCASRTRAEAW